MYWLSAFHISKKMKHYNLTFSKNSDSVPTPCLLASAIEESFKFSNLGFFCSNTKTEKRRHGYKDLKKQPNSGSRKTKKYEGKRCMYVPWQVVWSLELDDGGSGSRSDWASVCCWAAAFWRCRHGRFLQTLPSQRWFYLTAIDDSDQDNIFEHAIVTFGSQKLHIQWHYSSSSWEVTRIL